MKTSVEPLEGNKVKVSVEVDEIEFDKALDAAFRRIAREVRIPGFRPGKAPRALLQARIGADVARDERSEEHTSELQSRSDLVCRLLLEKKKRIETTYLRIEFDVCHLF